MRLTPELRVAAGAAFPRQVTGARATLERLERDVVERPADKPALIIRPGQDPAFRVRQRDRVAAQFTDKVVLDLRDASHYFQHDAPRKVAEAIRARFA